MTVFDFENNIGIKEVSGYNVDEKRKLLDILINFGVPSKLDNGSKDDDYDLLRKMVEFNNDMGA